MKKFSYVLTDAQGIHARPAGELVKAVKKYSSKVTISKGGKSAVGSKLLAVMSLGAKQGETVEITVEGADEETAAAELEKFMQENL